MKKLIILLMAAGLFTACENNKGKDKYDRDKSSADKRVKDDYRNSDNKANADNSKTSVNEDNTNLGSKTSNDGSDNNETAIGWPQRDKNGFIKSCVREAIEGGRDKLTAESYCHCMLDKIQNQYPDINVAAKLNREQIKEFGEKYRDECLQEH